MKISSVIFMLSSAFFFVTGDGDQDCKTLNVAFKFRCITTSTAPSEMTTISTTTTYTSTTKKKTTKASSRTAKTSMNSLLDISIDCKRSVDT
jgi:hypothetical protein